MPHPRKRRLVGTSANLARRVGAAPLLALLALAGACGGSDDAVTPIMDSGDPVDTGTVDSGTPDSTTPDVGGDADASMGTDSGTPTDAADAADTAVASETGDASSGDAADAADAADARDAADASDAAEAGGADAALAQMDLPVTFDSTTVDYGLVGFGGAEDSTIAADPTGGTNKVAKVNRAATAQTWAGTTVTNAANAGFAHKIPFATTDTRMTVRVYTPAAGIHVRLKVEDHTNPTLSVETEAVTTAANAWETLTFEFAAPAAGTAALDVTKSYDKASVFFDFGKDGPTAGARTYYFDDVKFLGGTTPAALKPMDLPVTFDDATIAYGLIGFGGAEDATIVVDPTGGTNKVAKVNRSATAQTWAGTTVTAMAAAGFAHKVPFAAGATKMTVRVYSTAIGKHVRLKVEDHTNAGITVETEALTTKTNTWETLTFDFATPATGTAALDLTKSYDKASLFYDFGTDGPTAGAETFYFDDMQFVAGTTSAWATITFDSSSIVYSLTPFGGEVALVSVDPVVATNMCAKLTKTATSELWAGTTMSTVGGAMGVQVPTIPFATGRTIMTARVYSPDIGVHVRLKAEDAADPTHTVETEAVTTAVGWQTLSFDFSSAAAGTATLNPGFTFNKLSIFPNFGTTGAMVGADKVYYADDIAFP